MATTPSVLSLLGSTRSEILSLVCEAPRTIRALTEELGLTPNAVREQLAILEKEGLVRRTVKRQGVGKPAHLYQPTLGGRELLSRAYQPALHALLRVLAERLPPSELDAALREAGRRLEFPRACQSSALSSRLRGALQAFSQLGAAAHLDDGEGEGEYLLLGQCCPVAGLVAEHPELCVMMESMLEAIAGVPIRERCDRGSSPRCRFVITSSGASQ